MDDSNYDADDDIDDVTKIPSYTSELNDEANKIIGEDHGEGYSPEESLDGIKPIVEKTLVLNLFDLDPARDKIDDEEIDRIDPSKCDPIAYTIEHDRPDHLYLIPESFNDLDESALITKVQVVWRKDVSLEIKNKQFILTNLKKRKGHQTIEESDSRDKVSEEELELEKSDEEDLFEFSNEYDYDEELGKGEVEEGFGEVEEGFGEGEEGFGEGEEELEKEYYGEGYLGEDFIGEDFIDEEELLEEEGNSTEIKLASKRRQKRKKFKMYFLAKMIKFAEALDKLNSSKKYATHKQYLRRYIPRKNTAFRAYKKKFFFKMLRKKIKLPRGVFYFFKKLDDLPHHRLSQKKKNAMKRMYSIWYCKCLLRQMMCIHYKNLRRKEKEARVFEPVIPPICENATLVKEFLSILKRNNLDEYTDEEVNIMLKALKELGVTRSYKVKGPHEELRLSDDDDEEFKKRFEYIRETSSEKRDKMEARKKLRKYICWYFHKKLKNKEEEIEPLHKIDLRERSLIRSFGTELEKHKQKYDIPYNMRIKSKFPLKLGSIFDQAFLLNPKHANNKLKECLQAFHTDTLYLGEGNVFGMNGYGSYSFPNGALYMGNFKDNMFHGNGRIIYPNKTIVDGYWFNGELLKPRLFFADGLYFEPENWAYLKFPDRLYSSEKQRGLLPDHDPQLTDDHPARDVPPHCYDTGEGFYSVKTNILHHPITGSYLRTPPKCEVKWILQYCRSHRDPNVPFMSYMFPAQYDNRFDPQEYEFDYEWYNLIYPNLSPGLIKEIRNQLVSDLAFQDFHKLRVKDMKLLCVPLLRASPPKPWYWVPILRSRPFYQSQILMRLPCSLLGFLRAGHQVRLCPGETLSYNSLDYAELYKKRYKKLGWKKFVKIMINMDHFIGGKSFEWTVKLEAKFLSCLKMLYMLDDAFVRGLLYVQQVQSPEKLDAHLLKQSLKLAIKGYEDKGRRISLKTIESYERKLRTYKLYARDARNIFNRPLSGLSLDSMARPRLDMYGTANWMRSTLDHIDKEMHVITTYSSCRN